MKGGVVGYNSDFVLFATKMTHVICLRHTTQTRTHNDNMRHVILHLMVTVMFLNPHMRLEDTNRFYI